MHPILGAILLFVVLSLTYTCVGGFKAVIWTDAVLGGSLIPLFARSIGPRATMTGMIASVFVMNLIYWPPKMEAVNGWWMRTFGGELSWPWFTLVGATVTVAVGKVVRVLEPKAEARR